PVEIVTKERLVEVVGKAHLRDGGDQTGRGESLGVDRRNAAPLGGSEEHEVLLGDAVAGEEARDLAMDAWAEGRPGVVYQHIGAGNQVAVLKTDHHGVLEILVRDALEVAHAV